MGRRNQTNRLSGLVWLGLLFSSVVAADEANPTWELRFIEQEAGVEPYPISMLVNKDFLRIDDTGRGFILFDRQQQRIYSVNPAEKTLLLMEKHPLPSEVPEHLQLKTQVLKDAEMPNIQGIKPVHHRYSVAQQECYNAINAQGLLPDVLEVLQEYRQLKAGSQWQRLENTPVEQRNDCMLSNLIYHAAAPLQAGFPIVEWNEQGYKRMLQNYQPYTAKDSDWTQLPQGYTELRF